MRSLLVLVLVVSACGSRTGASNSDGTPLSKDVTPLSKDGTSPARDATPPSSDATALSRDDVVFEAVFLHELARAALAAGEAACLRTRGATSDGTALLAAIQARYPTAIADSACTGGGPMGPVTVSATGGAAARFDIGPVEWLGPDHVRVGSGGAHRGGHSHETILELERSSGTWKVTSEKRGMTM